VRYDNCSHAGEFPVTANLTYLNHAAVAPLGKRAAEAMAALAADVCQFGSLHYDQWLQAYEGLRGCSTPDWGGSARNRHCQEHLGGIATVALGVDWKSGDKIIGFREEFAANYFPWKRLERRGVEIEWLSITDPLERIDAAAKGVRLLAISFVNYLSGYRVDLDAIGEICHRTGCLFFVDAIQGLGAVPLNVRESRIDALAADGQWLLDRRLRHPLHSTGVAGRSNRWSSVGLTWRHSLTMPPAT
jgi:selenocysteine lyase/cysteine desulfurase